MLRTRPLRATRLAAPLVVLSILGACAERIATEPTTPQARGGPSAAVVAPPGFIRIGVVPEADAVNIGATGSYRVLDETGTLLLTGSASVATVKAISVAVQVSFWRVQVQCSGNEPFVKDWTRRVAAAGYDPYTEYVLAAKCWRLRVGRFPTRTAALAEQPELHRLGLAPAATGGAAFAVTIFEGVTKYQATIGSAVDTSSTPIRVVPAEGSFLTIVPRNDTSRLKYRGVGEVRLNSLGSLVAINELPMEEYLLAVVPRELGPIAFPELEALKAQAVAARTYAYANMGKRKNDGYDLTNTTSDQVYGHVGNEHPLSSQAVTGTAGLVAKYEGRLISTLYSSTSGGFTANSEDVYANAFPYLRGVPDAERGKALDHVPSLEVFRNHGNPTSLRAVAEGDFESDWSKYHRWYVDWTNKEISDVLSAFYKKNVGTVHAINVPERSSSGRALRMEFVTDSGTFVATKDGIRSALKYVTGTGGQASLFSTLVFVQPVVDRKTKAITGFEAWGGGWGHGVGLSQTGAVGMAERGYTYDEILKHYYRGITVEQL